MQKVKFKMPVGARFNGLVHLGGGEFSGDILGGVPLVLEATLNSLEEDFSYQIEPHTEPPKPEILHRRVAVSTLVFDGKRIETLEEMVKLLGGPD